MMKQALRPQQSTGHVLLSCASKAHARSKQTCLCAAPAAAPPADTHRQQQRANLLQTTEQHYERGQEQHEKRRKQPIRLPMRDLIKLIRGKSGNVLKLQMARASMVDLVASKKEPNLILTSQIMASRSWQEAYALFIEFSDIFSPVNTAALITHISKLIHNSNKNGRTPQHQDAPGSDRLDLLEVLQELRDFSEGELPNYGPQGLANTACAFANLGMLSRRYAQLVIARSEPPEFSNKELTQLLWSFGAAGHIPDARWLRSCYSELAVRRSTLTNRELCSSLWALAKLKLDPGPGWMSIILFELHSRGPTLLEPDLVNVLWALATLRHQPPRQLLSTFLMASAKIAHTMLPKSLCIILWSASTGGWPIPPPWVKTMCEGLHHHCCRESGSISMSVSDAAMALHALGRLKFQPPVEITSSLSAVVVSKMGHHTLTEDLVSWSCGLAGLGYKPSKASLHRFFYACMKRRRLLKCSPNQLAAMLCALAKLDCDLPPIFVASASRQMQKRMDEWGPRELSNLMWALARLRQGLPVGLLSFVLQSLLSKSAALTSRQAAPTSPPPTRLPMPARFQSTDASHAMPVHVHVPEKAKGTAGPAPASMVGKQQHHTPQQQQHRQQPPAVSPVQSLGALWQLQQQQQQRQYLQQVHQPSRQLPHHQHSQQDHLHHHHHHHQQQQQQQPGHCLDYSSPQRPQLVHKYTWSNLPSLATPSLPFSSTHSAARAELQQQQAAATQQAIQEGSASVQAQGNGVAGLTLGPSRMSTSSNKSAISSVSSISSVGGSSGSISALKPQHVANALWALPWLLPPKRRFTFGNTHRPLLRAAERAWMGPYFRAACLRQGTRGMLLGAELAGQVVGQLQPQPAASSALTTGMPSAPLALRRAVDQTQAQSAASPTLARSASHSTPAARSDVDSSAGSPSNSGLSCSTGAPVPSSGRGEAASTAEGSNWVPTLIFLGTSNKVSASAGDAPTAGTALQMGAPSTHAHSTTARGVHPASNVNLTSNSAASSVATFTHDPTCASPSIPSSDAASEAHHRSSRSSNGTLKSSASSSSVMTYSAKDEVSVDTNSSASKGTHSSSSSSSSKTKERSPTLCSVNSTTAPSPPKLPPSPVRATSQSHSAPATANQPHTAPSACRSRSLPPSHEYAMGHNVAAEELSRTMAVPPEELMQTAVAFVALGYRPSAAWLHLHQWAAARQWPVLSLSQRKRLVRCYRSLCKGPARGANIGLAATPQNEVAGATCVLPMPVSRSLRLSLTPMTLKLKTPKRGTRQRACIGGFDSGAAPAAKAAPASKGVPASKAVHPEMQGGYLVGRKGALAKKASAQQGQAGKIWAVQEQGGE